MELERTNSSIDHSHRLELKAEWDTVSEGRYSLLRRRGDGMGNDKMEKKGRCQYRSWHYALWSDYYLWTGHSSSYNSKTVALIWSLKAIYKRSLLMLEEIRSWSPLPFLRLDNKNFYKETTRTSWERCSLRGFKALSLVSKACLPLWEKNWVA